MGREENFNSDYFYRVLFFILHHIKIGNEIKLLIKSKY